MAAGNDAIPTESELASYLAAMQSEELEFLTPLSIEAMAAKKAGLPVRKTGMGKSKAASFAKAYSKTVSKNTNLVVIGIAGACSSRLRPGDVVVANKIFKIKENGHIDDSIENQLTIPKSNVFYCLLQNFYLKEKQQMPAPYRLHNSPIGCSEIIIAGEARKNADSDQIYAVEMESFWLADILMSHVKTLQVVRIILDTPSNEIFSFSTLTNFRTAFRQMKNMAQLIKSIKNSHQIPGIFSA